MHITFWKSNKKDCARFLLFLLYYYKNRICPPADSFFCTFLCDAYRTFFFLIYVLLHFVVVYDDISSNSKELVN